MKKRELLLALGCLLPAGMQAICFRYVSGPNDMQRIILEVDSTKVGSYLPTQLNYTEFISKNSAPDAPYQTAAWRLIDTDNVYVTVKWEKGIVNSKTITLIKGKKLDANAAYDITIDDNRKVAFKKSNAKCPKAPIHFR